jgi:hypothetical protein
MAKIDVLGPLFSDDAIYDTGGQVYNAKSKRFNIKGDGTTDDTTAINSAISIANAAGGGVLFFPAGTYIIAPSLSATFIIAKSNVTICGAGPATKFKVKDSVGNFEAIISTPSTGGSIGATAISNFSIQDLTIDMNPSGNPAALPTIGSSTTSQFAIKFNSATGIRVRNVRFDPCTGINTVVLYGSDHEVSDCYFNFIPPGNWTWPAITNNNTAAAVAAGSITLDATASSVTDAYKGGTVFIRSATTGANQLRTISAYNGSTKVATISSNWSPTPTGTITYNVVGAQTYDNSAIYIESYNYNVCNNRFNTTVGTGARGAMELHAWGGNCTGNISDGFQTLVNLVNLASSNVNTAAALAHDSTSHVVSGNVIMNALCGIQIWPTHTRSSTAVSATNNTIVLDSGASAVDGFYNGQDIYIVSGTGQYQRRTVLGYVGSTKTVTIVGAWQTIPDATSVYNIHYVMRNIAITGNTIQIMQKKHNVTFSRGINVVWNNGINGAIEGLTITGNTITFEDESDSNRSITAEYLEAGIQLTPQANESWGVTVTGNTIIRSPGPGIRPCGTFTGSRLRDSIISKNTLIDCGQNLNFFNIAYRSAFFIDSPCNNVSISDNHIIDNGRTLNITALSAVGTTVTLTTDKPHGWTTGQKVTVANSTPSGYNGTLLNVASVPSPTSITYVAGTSPATATVLGTVFGIKGQYSIFATSGNSELWFSNNKFKTADTQPFLSAVNFSGLQGDDGIEVVPFVSTITPNLFQGNATKFITLTGNVTISIPSTSQRMRGKEITYVIVQDSTGGRTITWNAAYKIYNWLPDLTPNGITSIKFIVGDDATNFYQIAGGGGLGSTNNLALGTTNTPTTGIYQRGGQQKLLGVVSPSTPTISNIGTPGTTGYSYTIVAIDRNGFKTIASTVGSTTTGAATLNGTDFNRITWTAVDGAVSYDVVRTVSSGTPSSLGSIVLGTKALTFDDTGIAASAYTTPTRNTTADATIEGNVIAGGFVSTPNAQGALTTGGTINVVVSGQSVGQVQVSPASNVTGIILQVPTAGGREVTVVNESLFTITFATSGSNLAAGSSEIILAKSSKTYQWDAATSLWYSVSLSGNLSAAAQGASLRVGVQSGLWYTTDVFTRTTASISVNNLALTHISIDKTITLTEVGCNVTAIGTTGAVARLGVYGDDGTGHPSALLLDTGLYTGGLFDAITTGNKTFTLDGASGRPSAITLSPGRYWVGGVTQVAASTLTIVSGVSGGIASPNMASIFTANNTAYLQGSVSGNLPSTFTTGKVSTTSAICVGLKLV